MIRSPKPKPRLLGLLLLASLAGSALAQDVQFKNLEKVFREELLAHLSGVAERIETIAGLDGMAYRIRIGYRNFVTNRESGVDTVEVYAPVEQVRKFADDDLTGQQFLDASIVRVNDARSEVRLSED